MKRKSPFTSRYLKRTLGVVSNVGKNVSRELQCTRCKAVFPDYLDHCPECGNRDWISLAEVNPYTRMPMESFLKSCGHLLWIIGTATFLVLLWQTDDPDEDLDRLYGYGAILILFCSVMASAFYFGMSEMMRVLLRLQRRLRAFHEHYRRLHSKSLSSFKKRSSSTILKKRT